MIYLLLSRQAIRRFGEQTISKTHGTNTTRPSGSLKGTQRRLPSEPFLQLDDGRSKGPRARDDSFRNSVVSIVTPLSVATGYMFKVMMAAGVYILVKLFLS